MAGPRTVLALGVAAALIALAVSPWLVDGPGSTRVVVTHDHTRVIVRDRVITAGDTVAVSVRTTSDRPIMIADVIVVGLTKPWVIDRGPVSWPDSRARIDELPTRDQLDFELPIPRGESGGVHHLSVAVTIYTARPDRHGDAQAVWGRRLVPVELKVRTVGAARARRLGLGGAAAVGWVGALAAALAAGRWRRRHQRWPRWPWIAAVVIAGLAAGHGFVVVAATSLGGPGPGTVAAAIALWLAPLPAIGRLTARHGLARFRVVQAAAPTGRALRTAAYRVGAPVPRVPTEALPPAWQAAGFHVEPTAAGLRIARLGTDVVELPWPTWQHVGGGDAFEVCARDEALVAEVLAALHPVLGELRWHRL